MLIMRNTPSVDMCQSIQRLEKTQAYSKLCATFVACDFTRRKQKRLVVFCLFFNNVAAPELSNVGQIQNTSSIESLTFLTL